MNIEQVISKLRPLMPETVKRLVKNREFADPELKTLIEKQHKRNHLIMLNTMDNQPLRVENDILLYV